MGAKDNEQNTKSRAGNCIKLSLGDWIQAKIQLSKQERIGVA
jgi:hypothetical protein